MSEIAGTTNVISFVKDYQTLLAGVATVAALLIAVQQFKRQRLRDAVDAVRHYEREIEAMRGLRAEAARIVKASSGLAQMYGGIGDQIVLNKSLWTRLAQQTNASIAPAVTELENAVHTYNRQFDHHQGLSLNFGSLDVRAANEARFLLHAACSTLLEKIEKRMEEVVGLIKATS